MPEAKAHRPYSHLVAGPDYRQFEMAKHPRTPTSARVTALRERVQDDVQQFLDTHTITSVHEHLSVRPSSPSDFREYRRQGREWLPYDEMSNSGLDLVFDGGLASPVRGASLWEWDDVVRELGLRLSDIAHQDQFSIVLNKADVDLARSHSRLGVVLTIESIGCIGTDLDLLDVLYGFGVRSMGITYSDTNQFASGLAEACDSGLTRMGRLAVDRMNRLGVIIDVAHASYRTALEVCDSSSAPVIISHSGARSLRDIARLSPDSVIRACASTGGVIGISASPGSTMIDGAPNHDLFAAMAHLDYCVDMVGPEHVALGFDTHFGDHVAWSRIWSGVGDDHRPTSVPVDMVDGLENPAEATLNAIAWMFDRGYSETDIAMIAGSNVLRVIDNAWPL